MLRIMPFPACEPVCWFASNPCILEADRNVGHRFHRAIVTRYVCMKWATVDDTPAGARPAVALRGRVPVEYHRNTCAGRD